jgi:hypothetical protein
MKTAMSDIPTWHERAMAHPDHQSGMISEDMIRARMAEEISDLRAEVERLREALAFYADERHYKTRTVHMCGHFTGQSVMVDQGRQARNALEAKP